MSQAIGIDLGTTYSCAAIYRDGKHEIIKSHTGENTMASVVAFTNFGRIIGDEAKANSGIYPTETVFGAKRFIGRRFTDETLQRDFKTYPFEIRNVDGNPKVRVSYQGDTTEFWPEEISAAILQKIKDNAGKQVGKVVTKAVITVPAHFNDSQRQATKDAGKIAGLDVLRIINEPTAAALAYGIDKKYKNQDGCNVLIYDFGGGTFDVSVIAIDDGIFEVKSTNGDTYLGGDDIDLRLVKHFADEFKQKYNKDLNKDKRAIRRLRLQCENVKRKLSSENQASIEINNLFEDLDFYSGITRSEFEDLCTEIFRKTLHFVQEALNDAKMKVNDIDEVVLIGGSTRIPKIQEMVRKFFHGVNVNSSLNPDEAVAIGAAIQAAILNGNEDDILGSLLLLDVNPLSLGIEIIGDRMSVIIPRNTQIPTISEDIYQTCSDYQTTIKVSVYEGERKMVKENYLLGEFEITGLKKAKRGETKILVQFEINTDGILHVTASEKNAMKNSQSIDILMQKYRLSDNEIKRIIERAAQYKREDDKWNTIIEARIKVQNYCNDIKRQVDEDFNKVMTAEHQQIVTLKCDEVLKWIQKNQGESKLNYENKEKEVYNVCNPIIRLYR